MIDEHAGLRAVLEPLGTAVGLERLTGGMFATTWRVTFAERAIAVAKVAPEADERLMSYEHRLIRSESLVYDAVAQRPDLLMPRVLLTDFSHATVPSDVVVAEHLHGNLFVDETTGELIGVIDPERALWGDPFLDLVGADQGGRDAIAPGWLRDHAADGNELDVTSPSARAWYPLCRVYLCLVQAVEGSPRGYTGERADAYRRHAMATLTWALDELDAL